MKEKLISFLNGCKKWLCRMVRLTITASIIAGIVALFIVKPFCTLLSLITVLNLFVFALFPYWIIAAIIRKIHNCNYVCIVQPFRQVFITVRKKGYTEELPQTVIDHEQDHIRYFREGNVVLQSLKYVIYLVWYGYWDNPVEVRARKVSEELNGK